MKIEELLSEIKFLKMMKKHAREATKEWLSEVRDH